MGDIISCERPGCKTKYIQIQHSMKNTAIVRKIQAIWSRIVFRYQAEIFAVNAMYSSGAGL